MSVFSKLGEKLGLSKSEAKLQAERLEEVAARKRKCHDRLEALKERIKLLENRARKKQEELKATKGPRRNIVLNEAKQLLRELKKLGGEEKILIGQLNKLTTIEARISEIQVAGEVAVDETMVDDVALDLDLAHQQLEAEDRAIKDLEKVTYGGFAEEDEEDIEAELAKLEQDLAQETAETDAPQETTEAPEAEKAEAPTKEDLEAAEIERQLNELQE
jgi:hypothetical protein